MIRDIVLILVVGLPLCLSAQLQDQNQYNTISHIYLNHQSDPGSLYKTALTDREGYLWITSNAGLYVYDGKESIRYRSDDPQYPIGIGGLLDNYSHMICNQEGRHYFYSLRDKNILKFDPYNRTLDSYISLSTDTKRLASTLKINNDDILSIIRYSDSERTYAWTLLENDIPRDIKTWQYPTDKSELLYDHDITVDYVYLLTRFYFYQYDLAGNLVYKIKNNTEQFQYGDLYSDGQDLYLKKNDNQVLDKWDPIQHSSSPIWNYPKDLDSKIFTCIHNQKIVVGSSTKLYIHDMISGTTENLSNEYYTLKKTVAPLSLAEDISSITPNDDNSYLMATASEVYTIRPTYKGIRSFSESVEGLNKDLSTREVIKRPNGDLLLSYYTGLAIKEKGKKQFTPVEIRYPDNNRMTGAYSLNQWQDQLVFNTMKIDRTSRSSPLSDRVSYGHSENIIIGDDLYFQNWYNSSLFHYNFRSEQTTELRFDSVATEGGSISMVNQFCYDAQTDCIWMATSEHGLSLIDRLGATVKHVPVKEEGSIDNDAIYELFLDGNTMWMGTEKGLIKLHRQSETYERIPIQQIDQYGQIKYRTVYSILEVDDLHLLLGTEKGLVLFNKENSQIQELAPGHPLKQIEYNRNSRLKDGNRYYMGSTVGLFSFTMDDLAWDTQFSYDEAIKMYHLSYNGEEGLEYISSTEKLTEEIRLSPGDRNLDFRFSYPCIDRKIYYSYQIPSIDSVWTHYSTDNSIKLYALPYGHHTINIRASSTVNNSLHSSTSVHIFQDKEWYKKWWAFVTYIFLLIGGLYASYRYRIEQLMRYERLRTTISSDLHDEVGTILSSVAMQSEVLGLNAPPKKVAQFENLSRLSREAMGRMRDTVWAIDSRRDNVDSLVDRMKDYLADMSSSNQFEVSFTQEVGKLSAKLPPDVRQNVYLIFKEAVNNAYKYSNGNQLSIELKHSSRQIQMTIRDNGHVDPSTIKKSGIGLSNMRMRAKRISAKLDISYDDGFQVALTSSN